MRILKSIRNPQRDEHLLAVDPELRPDLVSDWRRRLNFFTGRSLSHRALEAEQTIREAHLALRGQVVSSGVIEGLEVGLERGEGGTFLHLNPGTGLTPDGNDVTVPQPLRVPIHAPQVYIPPETGLGSGDTQRSLAALIASADAEPLPRACILLLTPVTIPLSAATDSTDPCALDEQDEAFADWQWIDGLALTLYIWPLHALPLPPFDANQWQNQLAHAIFAAEALLAPEERMPWEHLGVPVGLVGFDANWNALFVDCYAVVRAGGKPRRRTPLLPEHGNPFLWQARMQHFSAYMAELSLEQMPIEQIAARVRFMPPAGILPAGALEPRLLADDGTTRAQNHFFPPGYVVETLPVVLEQLDVVLEASASLDPFDLRVPDRVRVAVPVPQVWYEPDLLRVEVVDDEFQTTLAAFELRRNRWLGRRVQVHQITSALVKAITGEALVYPDPDPDAVGEETILTGDDLLDANDPALAEPEAAYGTTLADGGPVVTVRQELRDWLAEQALLREPEMAQFDQMGLSNFIVFLQERVKQADDRIDLGFVQAQTNMYRLRQLLMGNVGATRLATSTALPEIARSDSAIIANEEIRRYLGSVVQPDVLKRAQGTPIIGDAPTPGDLGGRGLVAGATIRSTTTPGMPPAGFSGATPRNLFLSGEVSRLTASLAGRSIPDATVAAELAAGWRDLSGGRGELALDSVRGQATTASGGKLFATPSLVPPQEAIIGQAQLVGKGYDFRTMTVAERLRAPEANEAKEATIAAKFDVASGFHKLLEMGLNLDEISVPGVAVYQDGRPVFEEVGDGRTRLRRESRTLRDLAANNFLDLLRDPDPADADEAEFFSLAVQQTEHTIAVLRLVEGRMRAYRAVITRCEQTLKTITDLAAQADRRLKLIGDELAEARHDVAVATALLAEETARIAAINDRRNQIIAEHVTFLAYYRPRLSDHRKDVPVRFVDNGLVAAPIPACLARRAYIAPELREMVALLRETPLKWLNDLRPLLQRLDRVETMVETILTARNRAQLFQPAQYAIQPAFQSQNLLASGISRVYTAQQQIVVEQRSATARLDLNQATIGKSWQHTRVTAEEHVTLNDLLNARHSRSDIVDQATTALNQIMHVAACLYNGFAAVLPALRLTWAERLSQYDEPVNLRNLASLPRWGEIDRLERRELQTMADWLFLRVDDRVPEATSFINDLVRVCILLASHAPVNELVAASIEEATTASEGSRVRLKIDPAKVHVGMIALLYQGNTVVAQALVDDLAGSVASVQVIKTMQPTVQLEVNGRVQLAEPSTLALSQATSQMLRNL
ncbi:hypothetical protein [Candidatus Chloroploca sp. Khr17]|uniref:hypothetical protein n=1 Tax=Candidatus Chloroploca sp. Khr17 TaxID=2496869 RepID=UPI00101C5AB7|nr:hypothetical protein [Candidatus Chloroploca sp. Khr17]